MPRAKPCLGYPSAMAAVRALMREGLGYAEILRRTGIPEDNLSSSMTTIRRQLAEQAGGVGDGWSPERIAKAQVLFTKATRMIADAMGVPVAEYLRAVNFRPGAAAPAAATSEGDDGKDDARQPDGGNGVEPGGGAVAGNASPPVAPIVAVPVVESSASTGGAPALAIPEARPAPPPDRPAEPAQEPPEQQVVFRNGEGFVPPPAAEPLDDDGQVIARARAGAQFILRATDGAALHESCTTLTRTPRHFWRGAAKHLRAVRRRYPQWKALKAEAV